MGKLEIWLLAEGVSRRSKQREEQKALKPDQPGLLDDLPES